MKKRRNALNACWQLEKHGKGITDAIAVAVLESCNIATLFGSPISICYTQQLKITTISKI